MPYRSTLPYILTKLELGNQAHIDISTRIGGLHGNPPSIPAHQPHQPNPVVGASTLHIRRTNGSDTLSDGCLKSEALVDDGDVVVDGLGDADNGDL